MISSEVSPAAKRLAETMNLDLKTVIGTGAGGMIMREDVLKAARTGSPQPGLQTSKLVPMSSLRATIAERLVKSQHETAHVTLTREAEVKNLVTLVKERLSGSEVTFTDVLIKVAAEALGRHPMINSRLEEDRIRLLNEININFAVAVEAGLIAPTVRSADKLSIAEISRLVRELSEKARERKLTSAEYADGTFTVSNLGMFGIDGFTPIINPPQVAILGTGRILERPWVEGGQVKVLPTMVLSLTFDHRVVDGADAARFLDTIVSLLTDLAWIK
ncbi:MAG: 2-oxo acid dehydrogenase subunit E2 [Thaumarchaeota archaeon]|nr:2-oxo acid dehydrogenase subunit E2 [Nitrososphaerota archaeon]